MDSTEGWTLVHEFIHVKIYEINKIPKRLSYRGDERCRIKPLVLFIIMMVNLCRDAELLTAVG